MARSYSFAEVLQTHQQKRNFEKQYPLARFVLRPLSFVFSYLLLRVTRSPAAVALASLFFGLAGCIALAQLPRWSVWPGLALLVVFDLLDACDGVVARTTGNVTYFGRFLDGVVGEIVEFYLVALAVGLYRAGPEAAGLTVTGSREDARAVMLLAGALCVCFRLFGDHVASGYYHYLRKVKGVEEAQDVRQEVQTSSYRHNAIYLIYLNLASFDFRLLLLVLCAMAGLLDLYLYGYAAFYLIEAGLFTLFYLERGRRRLVS